MAKILLVEDDNNLREIYEARLQAEGYDIVSAQDGEAALVVAKKEHPDLVISDVMMPRISGFEMLDIMRNTEGLRDVKVIMLTALGQAEDKTRADKLGADKYLVKSQVTLEDIVKTAGDLLNGSDGAPTAVPAAVPAAAPIAVTPPPATPAPAPPAPAPTSAPMAPAPQPVASTPVPAPVTPEPVAPAPAMPATPEPQPQPAPAPAVPATPPATPAPEAPVVSAPVAPAPAAPIAPAPQPAASAGDDSQTVIADAVKDLLAGSPQSAAPSTPAPVPAPVPAPPVALAAVPTEPTMPMPAAPDPTPAPATPVAPAPPPAMPPALVAPTSAPAVAAPAAPTDPPQQPLQPPAPIEPPAAAPEAPAPAVAPAEPVPAPAVPAPDQQPAEGETTRKKVIQPLSSDAAPEQPNLSDLLAKEGITDFDKDDQTNAAGYPNPNAQPAAPTPPGMSPLPHAPGHVISPNPVNAQGQPVDPNSISL